MHFYYSNSSSFPCFRNPFRIHLELKPIVKLLLPAARVFVYHIPHQLSRWVLISFAQDRCLQDPPPNQRFARPGACTRAREPGAWERTASLFESTASRPTCFMLVVFPGSTFQQTKCKCSANLFFVKESHVLTDQCVFNQKVNFCTNYSTCFDARFNFGATSLNQKVQLWLGLAWPG